MDKKVFLVVFVNGDVSDVITIRKDYSVRECSSLREALMILADGFRFISPAPDNFSLGWKNPGKKTDVVAFVKTSEVVSIKYVLVLSNDNVQDAMNDAASVIS